LKVLHVIPSVSDQSGGPAQAIFPMCRALMTRGLEVTITTTNDGLTDHPLAETNGNGHKLQNVACNYRGTSTHFFPVQWGHSFKYSRPLASWLDENVKHFDVVHIHAVFNHACLAAARACRKSRVPYIVRPLGTLDPWSLNQKSLKKKLFWKLAGQKMLNQAGAVHYTTQAELRAVENLLSLSRGKVVPLGVEFDDVTVGVKSQAKVFEAPYVLVLSRLHSKKGLDVLIDAFCELKKLNRFSQWRLVIAGDGNESYVRYLKQLASDKDAPVTFCGWLQGPEKTSVLRNASLLALPSRQENFGLCVLEALSQGVPVLVSPEVNLAEEIKRAGAGWISAVDKSALAETLASALSNEEERIKRGAAGKKFSQNFEWDVIAEKLEDMYVSLAGSRD
jgi:glycosyltransferase involved in cell wall biosynthesis